MHLVKFQLFFKSARIAALDLADLKMDLGGLEQELVKSPSLHRAPEPRVYVYTMSLMVTYRSKVGKGYLKVQGWQRVP